MWPFPRNPAEVVRTREAFWLLRNGIGDARPRATGATDCDIAIIGAGITAALVTDALVPLGARIVVLDQGEIAQGSTAASTALLQYESDTHLVDLVKFVGAERATRAYRACVQTFPLLEQRFPELLDAADYERRESLYLAADEDALPAFRAEVSARRAIGISCELVDPAELGRRFGCRRPAGILSPLGAQLDPLRLARGIFASCERHGVEIRTRTRVESIDEQGERLSLSLGERGRLEARHVVVCAGYESLKFLPDGFANLDNTYALATEPLDTPALVKGVPLQALPLIWESARPYVYIRGTRDGRVIVGGADVPFKGAVARDLLLTRQLRKVTRSFEQLFGRPLPPVACAWAGSFATTKDGLPFIGRVPGRHPGLQFALCLGGNGITYAVHAGAMIRAGIEGGAHELDDTFGFARQGFVEVASRAKTGR